MKVLRRVVIALLAVAALAMDVDALAASTTNYSDQWWVPEESGWGAAVLQQGSTLFIDLLVYGADGKPAWFTAAAPLLSSSGGRDAFGGDLWATTGPSFAGRFDPAAVNARKVGALLLAATGPNAASLSYSVDGVPVAKSLVRQTWAVEDLSGNYKAAWHYRCASGTSADEWFALTVTQDAQRSVTLAITIVDTWWTPVGTRTLKGTYAANGRLGSVVAELQPPDRGTLTLGSIERSFGMFTGTVAGTINGCEVVEGAIAAAAMY